MKGHKIYPADIRFERPQWLTLTVSRTFQLDSLRMESYCMLISTRERLVMDCIVSQIIRRSLSFCGHTERFYATFDGREKDGKLITKLWEDNAVTNGNCLVNEWCVCDNDGSWGCGLPSTYHRRRHGLTAWRGGHNFTSPLII